MKYIEKVFSYLFKKRNLLYLIFLISLITLHTPIELVLTNSIVKYVLSYIESSWYNDIVFSLIIIFTFLLALCRYKKYMPSKNLLYILFTATVIYSLYRLHNNIWSFTSFSFYNKIKYADVLIIASVCNLFLFVKEKNLDKSNGENSFFDDEPIGGNKEDVLGYTTYADLLASKIKDSHFNKSFAIGINGKWGLGKTSFIDILKRKMDRDKIIEINFNPWNSNSPKAIIQDFFETIQEHIRPYHSSLSRLLISYSNKLVSLNDNTVTQSIQTSVTALTGYESLSSLFTDINNDLKEINRKILIYIDDLDRLDKDEIIEVIRLIRNTANFHNTFFIVAYDRNYVVNALKNHTQYKQEQFLEKIFQIEIMLPHFKKDIFRRTLAKKLKEKFPLDLHQTIDDEIIGSTFSIPTYLDEWLENMRDVTRLANSLVLNLNKLIGEVDFNDFLRLELLRIKYPSVYALLFNKTNIFLTFISNSYNKNRYTLIETKNTENGKTKYLEIYLKDHWPELSIPENDINKIVSYLNNIFSDTLISSYYDKKNLSVVYPSKFNRYFAYNLLEDSLSEIAFSKARNMSRKDFNKKIEEWVNQNLESELKNKFVEIKSYDNREDFEKVISAIFHFASLKNPKPDMYRQNIIGYDGKDLYKKLNDYKDFLAESYYKDIGEGESLKEFILKLLTKAASPFTYEAAFIRHVNAEFSDSFSLTKNELSELVINYFKTYCQHVQKLDNSVWHLYHCCRKTEWLSGGGGSYHKNEFMPEEVKEIMKKFILNKDLDGFLLSSIDPEPFDQNKFAIGNFVPDLFGDWLSFKVTLDQQSEEKWKFLKEYKDFLMAYEKPNFSYYVEFNFKVIPIKEKLKKIVTA
jgi:hypothetical protein